MSRRTKKKYLQQIHTEEIAELKCRNAELLAQVTLLVDAQKQTASYMAQLEERLAEHANATNTGLDHLRGDTKMVWSAIEELQRNAKRSKKSFFKRG